jgi:hypothetical protein
LHPAVSRSILNPTILFWRKPVAKVSPKSQAKPASKSTRKTTNSLREPPSRAAFTKALLDDLSTPLVPADAIELFAVKVVDIARKFDPFWYQVLVDLATHVVYSCEEEDIRATIQAVADDIDGLRAHIIRRRINRNLPHGPGESRLTETERYELARAIVVAAVDTLKDEALWDGIWGRKASWFPVILSKREPAEDGAEEGEGTEKGSKGSTGYKADRRTDDEK